MTAASRAVPVLATCTTPERGSPGSSHQPEAPSHLPAPSPEQGARRGPQPPVWCFKLISWGDLKSDPPQQHPSQLSTTKPPAQGPDLAAARNSLWRNPEKLLLWKSLKLPEHWPHPRSSSFAAQQPAQPRRYSPHMPAWGVSHSTEMLPYPSEMAPLLVEGLTQVPQCQDTGSSLRFSGRRRAQGCQALSHHPAPGLAPDPLALLLLFKDSKP